MHEIDRSFKDRKLEASRRASRLRRRRIIASLAAVVILGGGFAGYRYAQAVYYPMDEDLVAVDEVLTPAEEAQTDVAPQPVYVPAVVDLPGDPLLITLAAGSSRQSAVRTSEAPSGLIEATDDAPSQPPSIAVLSDVMMNSSERFMAALPSSPEDFAFFQSQRNGFATEPPPSVPPAPAVPAAGDEAEKAAPASADDEGAGWGETIDEGQQELPSFTKTRIEDTTSVAIVVPETERRHRTEDVFVRVLDPKSVEMLLNENGFAGSDGAPAGEALKAAFALDSLPAGTVVGMRGIVSAKAGEPMRLVQLSVYNVEHYLGTIARTDENGFVRAADPWVGEDIGRHFDENADTATTQRYRLIDAIYSTAARNQVPTGIIGEAIMHLSRAHDLNDFADFSQRLLLVYSSTPRDAASQGGRVLYASIRGKDGTIDCFVYRPTPNGDFGCLTELNDTQSLSVQNGMVVPVKGVMTSTFGPRRHPILGTVRLHKGVDWAAPVGTPVVAAFAGTIELAGDGGDYGNLVKIDHGGGRETRYAHLSRFAEGLKAGQSVAAGDLVGYIGTSGLSTGPHLHFELYASGTPIDPLGATMAVAQVEDDGGAVDQLVNKIVHVESGGRADAKNPLSSATGLGQFITSTWLRMMATYRPDLVRSLSRDDLLALRNDPTLSREMVQNLARENEASLRANGHAITAGRLYLAHFLGPGGANIVLAASPDSDLATILGDSVISANPFLTGKNASYVMTWAERKMSGRAAPSQPDIPAVSTKEVTRASPAFEAYKKAILDLVSAETAAL